MKITRGRFLKLCLVSLGMLFVSPKLLFAINRYKKFKPDLFYGEWVKIFDEDLRKEATRFLYKRMAEIIPPEYRDKKYIKFIHKKMGWAGTFDPLIQYGSVGWKYTPEKSLFSKLKTNKRIYFKNKKEKLISTDYPTLNEKYPWLGWGNNAENSIRTFR